MTAPENNPASLRLERLDTSRIFWAFTLSVAVHLFVWGGYTGGKKLGLWEKLHLPAWVQKLAKPLVMVAKQPVKTLAKESEPPLMFVDVSPDQAMTEPPKDAKYYSSLNSQAANPKPDRDTNVPKIDGTQEHVPKTEDAERNKFSKLQPSFPAEKPPSEPRAVSQPQPSRPAEKAPSEERAVSRPKIAPGDLVLAKPEENPRTDTGSAEKPRVRLLSQLPPDKIIHPPGRKMKQDGGVKRFRLEPSLDVKATPFGAYDAQLIDAVRNRWYVLLEGRNYAAEGHGHVAIQFKLHSDGNVTEITTAENTVSETLALLCYQAIHDPVPFLKWSEEMRRMVGESFRRIQFTFYYN